MTAPSRPAGELARPSPRRRRLAVLPRAVEALSVPPDAQRCLADSEVPAKTPRPATCERTRSGRRPFPLPAGPDRFLPSPKSVNELTRSTEVALQAATWSAASRGSSRGWRTRLLYRNVTTDSAVSPTAILRLWRGFRPRETFASSRSFFRARRGRPTSRFAPAGRGPWTPHHRRGSKCRARCRGTTYCGGMCRPTQIPVRR